jgi:hypothetical protein
MKECRGIRVYNQTEARHNRLHKRDSDISLFETLGLSGYENRLC